MLPLEFFDREVTAVARALLGVTFLVDGVGGVIVETEAYHPTDPASHSFRGLTERNAAMFAGPGRAYVYRSYGIHWCVNVVAEGGSAVLIRALEPTHGLAQMSLRRGLNNPLGLCSGPGKLCQALGITGALNNLMLDQPPFELIPAGTAHPVQVGPRIGITKAADVPWRFGVAGSPFLSKRFPSAGAAS